MPLRRSLSWSAALVGIKADRVQLPAGAITAKSRIEAFARIRKISLVTATGAYDRSAIVTMAVEVARAHQERTGETWSVCMAAALKGAWMAAQYARHRAAH